MFISKFDLYRSGWLELVFDDRNKSYGAYDLRKHYASNMLKAMGIAFLGISALFIICGMLMRRSAPIEIIKEVPVTLDPIIIAHPARIEQPKPATHHLPKTTAPAASTRYAPMITVPENQAVNPPKTEVLVNTTIGTETVKGPETTGNAPAKGPGTDGPAIGSKGNSNEPVSAIGLDVMPEPYGGAAAWSKFLQKNIHYPSQASEAGKQGRVWLSFVIERDGHLSNIVVQRGAGFGLDEEALRVLKLAPAWKPGKQNGQPVRVQYSIPISFVIPDSE